MSMKCERVMLQDHVEFDAFKQLALRENVRSYLEIGCKHGGTLWNMSFALPRGARVVAVDLPHGDLSFKESGKNLIECVDALKRRGFDAHLFLGDSTDPKIVESVRALGPYDLVFIDANHTEPYVRRDWANYGPLGRVVAFHDIGWRARPEPTKKLPIEVPEVWAEIKQGFRSQEIRNCPRDNGIGVLWRT